MVTTLYENKEIPLTPFGKGEWRTGIPLEKGDTGGFLESTTLGKLFSYSELSG